MQSTGISTCSRHRSRNEKEMEMTNLEPGSKITEDERIARDFLCPWNIYIFCAQNEIY